MQSRPALRTPKDTVFTLAQYTALSKALASGVRRVSVEGRLTEYQSAEDMQKTLAMMKAELQAAGLLPSDVAVTNVNVIGRKGLW